MFTGIITDVGAVRTAAETAVGRRLTIDTGYDPATIAIGGSIACAGICLTVVEIGETWFGVDVSHETLSRTTLGRWEAGRKVNLERALQIGDELGGHLVLGHVDGVGEVAKRSADGDNIRFLFDLPDGPELAPLVARKGSVAVDGVSLTVNEVTPARAECQQFGVNLIPHTVSHTSLGDLDVGAKVNLEVDPMARYAARMADFNG